MAKGGKAMSSFQKALNEAKNSYITEAVAPEIASMSLRKEATSVILNTDEEFIVSDKYSWYETYHDEDFSYVDNLKNINVNTNQINITQEENSQVVPFELNRYYDGVDLMEMNLRIHFVNANGDEGFSTPINVNYSATKIRFYWLIGNLETAIKGYVSFEIQATGTNEKNQNYIWKTKPNKTGINVLESLSGNGIIKPSEEWYTTFIKDIDLKIAEARDAANEAKSYAEEAQSAVEDVDTKIVNVKDDIAEQVVAEIETTLSKYYTSDEIDALLKDIDISSHLEGLDSRLTNIESELEDFDGLANLSFLYDASTRVLTIYNGEETIDSFELNSNPSAEWTSAYDAKMDSKINDATSSIQTDFEKYKTQTDSDLQSIHENIDNLPSTLESDYYTKPQTAELLSDKVSNSQLTEVTRKVSAVESDITINKENISALGSKVGKMEDAISNIDLSPRLTYDVAYNDIEDTDVGENVFVFYEIENEGKENEVKEIKKKFTIAGGSSGSASSSSLKIGYITTSPFVVTVEDKAIIKYTFSGIDSSGDSVPEGTATWKIGSRVIATNTALSGENSFDVTDYLSVGTQKVNLSIADEAGNLVTKTWTIQKIDVRLESTFNDKLTYPIGKISFDYIPYGAISKDVHFVLDGEEIGKITTTSSGIPMAYELPSQEHGAHLLEVYMTAKINGNKIESNHIVKDVIWYDNTSSVPVIGTIYQNFTARQYDATNIEYTVYDPSTETPTVEIAVDGNVVSTPVLDKATNVYTFKTDIVGEHAITITCDETVKTLKVNVTKLDIEITPVTTGLAFDFNPSGKSNNDIDRVWSDGTVSMSVSDNFDWVNGGYHYDKNGDQYFCIKAGTSAEIDYELFADDAKKNGKEFKLVFKTTNVAKPDATFLHCLDNTTGTDNIGIRMDVHEAFIYGQADKLHLPYSEEDIIEFEFNISKNTESVPMVMGYEDGVSTVPMVYDDSYNFTQNTPKNIFLGSEDCDLHIYRFKVYNTSLTDKGILNNFIADARNAEEMVARYDRNQIYDENQNLDPDVLAEKCPWLRIIKIEAPHFTTGKKYPINNTTIEYIYKDGDPILDNWKATDCVHVGQGTSSDNYGAAGRNIDLVLKSHKDFNNSPVITLSDGTVVDKVSLTRNSIPVNYFNVKVNIASSENANNALLQRRYNEYNPYKRAFVRDSEDEIAKIKDTMEFYNCVVFIKETGDVSEHSEFADNEWHFYAIGNIGDSKKTDKTRLTDPDDKYECINEIVDVELPLSAFPSGEEAIAILEAEKFDKSGTYEWRYIWEDGTDDENAEVAEYCKQRWIDFYKFVVNSTDEEFKANLGDYFVLDSALYYYLFTTRYTMVDNRAKNSFWHYGKCADGKYRWDLSFDYDNDTSLGINNYGDMVYRYGLEDKHVDENGVEIFREANSTFFCRLRDLFKPELKAMYNTLEGQGAWSSENLIAQFDDWQSQFPEELWRIDIIRKYIRTFTSSHIDGKAWEDALRDMAHGRKKYQRREFERGQEQYMASAYQSGLAASDENSIVIRCAKVTDDNLAVKPNYSLTLTPYAYMYLNVEYSTEILQKEVTELGKPITLTFDGDSTDIIKIYSASTIQSLGDLSPCYARTIDAGAATKLKELIIGNNTLGYDNPHLSSLTTGANYLLERLNIENVSGLTTPLNLTAMNNLKELYAHGSNIGGVTFADGGRIEIAELPAINALNIKNLVYLASLDISDFTKLTTLTVENCNTVDLLNVLNKAENLNRVRITGFEWNLEDTSLLERLYNMKGIDKNGYNTAHSVLAGKVHVPVIRQQQLYNYKSVWSDLDITFNTMVEQFSVTFKNKDGNILDIQYVDKGGDAVNPITRDNNPIDVPTVESTVSHDFTFNDWDTSLTNIFSDRVITATYTESLRVYTIKYVSKGITLQENTAVYGSYIPYIGVTPTYTAEEAAYVYHLFNRWDKSGIVDGDKTITALFDRCEYRAGYFDNKELADLTPVEIYTMTKLELETSVIEDMDMLSFTVGKDYNYDDVESTVIISEKTSFTGANYLDTGVSLLDEDRDFVLAIDYEFLDGSPNNSVLAQCFQSNGSNGFKLWYNNGVKFSWGTASSDVASLNNREMLVVRHRKGENNLWIYNSNLNQNEAICLELTRTKDTVVNSSLVFGCTKADDGAYENYAVGDIHWCKLWYADLGDEVCKSLAIWTREKIAFSACGFKKYYLADNPTKRCSFSLLATHLLERSRYLYPSSNSINGGWESMHLNILLNTRLYEALPDQWKALIKNVTIPSVSVGSSEVNASNCYIAIPALIEVDPTKSNDPYVNEGSTISYMTTDTMRQRAYDGGNPDSYWTRTFNSGYSSNYVWQIDENGKPYGFMSPINQAGVLIEISI